MTTVVNPPVIIPRPPYPQQWWQGAPSGINSSVRSTLSTSVMPPFALWRYDYVPDPNWLGKPTDDAAVWLTTTQVKFFGQPGQAPTKFWRYDLVPQPDWLGTPIYSKAIQLTNTQVKFFGQPGQAPTKFWRYDFVPEREWVGKSFPLNFNLLKSTPPGGHKPFGYDYVPSPNWLGTPIDANYNLLKSIDPRLFEDKTWDYFNVVPTQSWSWQPQLNTQLFSATTVNPFIPPQQTFNYSSTIGWVGQPTDTSTSLLFSLTNLMPPASFWRYDLERDKEWIGKPTPVSNSILLPPGASPFLPNFWDFNYVPAPVWTWNGSNTFLEIPPQIIYPPVEVPLPDPTFKGWVGTPLQAYTLNFPAALNALVPAIFWRYDYDPSPSWRPYAQNPQTLFAANPPPSPFIPRMWRWDFDPAPNWAYKFNNTSVRVPQTNPFFKLWRYDYVPQPNWVWKAPQDTSNRIPQTNPFFKLWRYDYVPTPNWNWQAPGLIHFPPQVTFYGAPGQVPTKLWRWDHVPSPVWLGKPRSGFNLNTPAAPLVPHEPQHGGPFPRSKHYKNLTKNILPTRRTFRTK